MIYLLFSILAFTFIFVVFKLFEKFQINILHAIVVNYIVAFITSLIAYNNQADISQLSISIIIEMDWFYYTFILGILFIVVFILIAKTTQISGLSVASVATKMSVVIPIVFGLVYYKESLGFLKLLGILFALLAVYLVSNKSKTGISINKKDLILPILVFLGSGIIDTSIKYLEEAFVGEDDISIFSAILFLAAAIFGLIVVLFQAIRGNLKIELKNIIAGTLLGIPNYFSIYFLVKALRSDILESSGVFAINNVAIVTLSTIVGIILFQEKLLPKNWVGILLAIVSIILIAI